MKTMLFIFCLLCLCNPVLSISVSNIDELLNVIDNETYIYVESGEYYINYLDVPVNTTIEGSGINTVFIKENGSIGYGIGVKGNNVKLCNFVYDGNALNCPNSDHGIRLDPVNNVEITGIEVKNTVHHGITSLPGSSNVNIHDNRVIGTGVLNSADGAGIIVNGYNCVVSNNIVSNTAYHGLQAYTNSREIIFSNNLLRNCGNNLRPGSSKGSGIKASLNTSNVIIMGNSIYNQAGEGVLIDQADSVIVAGNIINNATRSIYERNSNRCIINGNIVLNSRDHGIYLYNSNISNVIGNNVNATKYPYKDVFNYNGLKNIISCNNGLKIVI